MSTLYSMKTFNESYMTLDSLTVNSNSKDNHSFFESMIEFDDKMCLAEINRTKQFYSSMLESSEYVLHEGVISSIIDFIKNTVSYIVGFFKAIFSGSNTNGKSIPGMQKNIESKQNSVKTRIEKYNAAKVNYKKSASIKVYHYPTTIPTTLAEVFNENIMSRFNEISKFNYDLNTAVHNDPKKSIANQAKIKQITAVVEGLIKDIQNYNIAEKFKVETTTSDVVSYCDSAIKDLTNPSTPKGKLSSIKFNTSNSIPAEELAKFTKTYSAFEAYLTRISKDNEAASKLLNPINTLIIKEKALVTVISNKFAAYCFKILTFCLEENAQLDLLLNAVIENKDFVAKESSIFDDIDDYFLAETQRYKYTKYEAIREGIIKEALIIGNPDSDIIYEMQSLNEDFKQKAKNAFNNFVEKLKQLISTFMEKLRRNFTTTKHYLDKYKNVILKNKVPNGTFTGKDIINGMYKVINVEVPAFNYNAVKDQLKDPVTFHNYLISQNKRFMNNLPNNLPAVNGADNAESLKQIGEYWKTVFGCAGDDVSYTSVQIQEKIKDLYDFCYDIRKIDRMLNKALTDIETMRKTAVKQTGQEVVADPNAAAEGQKVEKAEKNESYFSYIGNYQSIMEKFEPAASTNNAAPAANSTRTNMTGHVASNTRTVGQVNQTNGQNDYGTQGMDNSQVDKDCEVYAQVATKVIQAKLTAIEYIRVEAIKIFRVIVESSINNTATSNPQATNSGEMQNIQTNRQ